MRRKATVDEFVSRPVRAVIFGDNGYSRGVWGRLMQCANDSGQINANCIMVRDHPCEKAMRQFNRYALSFRNGAKEVLMDVNCVTQVIDPFNDYDAFSALADNKDITMVLWAPERKSYLSDDGKVKSDGSTAISQLAMLLFRRFCQEERGFEIISAVNEDQNGDVLKKEIIEYANGRGLGMDFINWLSIENSFINTFIETRIGAQRIDSTLLVNAEKYMLAVFDKRDRLLVRSGLVHINEQFNGYYVLRRHIYEGALTASCAYSLLHDVPTLDAFMFRDKLKKHMIISVFEEIIPALDVNFETVQAYTVEMLQRFEDATVTVNWRDYADGLGDKVRKNIIPVISRYVEVHQRIPKHLTFALFCTVKLYKLMNIGDSFSQRLEKSEDLLKDTALWGEDISYLREELEYFEKKMG